MKFKISITIVIVITLLSLVMAVLFSASTPKTKITYWPMSSIHDASGHVVTRAENPKALPISYSNLVTFLKQDKIDEQKYTDTFQCVDFAEALQHDAELAGWQCAFVVLTLNTGRHCINAFPTSDGLIYIDATGIEANTPGPVRCVKTVYLELNQPIIEWSLFHQKSYVDTWPSIGTVTKIDITW